MLLTVLGVGLLAFGLATGWYGLRPLSSMPQLLRAEVRDPGALRATGEFVACRGTAAEAGETLSAPFTGTECLGLEFEVTERQPFGFDWPWIGAHLDDGVATVPFTLAGERGAIHVDPSPRRFALDVGETVVKVGSEESPPDRIRRFLATREGLPETPEWLRSIPGLGTRRYVERRIDAGEEYVVAGRVERRYGDVVLGGDLVVADSSPASVATDRLLAAAFPLLVSVAFVVGGGWLLVA